MRPLIVAVACAKSEPLIPSRIAADSQTLLSICFSLRRPATNADPRRAAAKDRRHTTWSGASRRDHKRFRRSQYSISSSPPLSPPYSSNWIAPVASSESAVSTRVSRDDRRADEVRFLVTVQGGVYFLHLYFCH